MSVNVIKNMLAALATAFIATLGVILILGHVEPEISKVNVLLAALVVFMGATNLWYMILGDLYE